MVYDGEGEVEGRVKYWYVGGENKRRRVGMWERSGERGREYWGGNK